MADLHVIEPEPVGEAVLAYLGHVLEKAQQGHVSAVAVAFVYRDGTTGSGYSALPNTATMVGAVDALKAKLIRDMLDG